MGYVKICNPAYIGVHFKYVGLSFVLNFNMTPADKIKHMH